MHHVEEPACNIDYLWKFIFIDSIYYLDSLDLKEELRKSEDSSGVPELFYLKLEVETLPYISRYRSAYSGSWVW